MGWEWRAFFPRSLLDDRARALLAELTGGDDWLPSVIPPSGGDATSGRIECRTDRYLFTGNAAIGLKERGGGGGRLRAAMSLGIQGSVVELKRRTKAAALWPGGPLSGLEKLKKTRIGSAQMMAQYGVNVDAPAVLLAKRRRNGFWGDVAVEIAHIDVTFESATVAATAAAAGGAGAAPQDSSWISVSVEGGPPGHAAISSRVLQLNLEGVLSGLGGRVVLGSYAVFIQHLRGTAPATTTTTTGGGGGAADGAAEASGESEEEEEVELVETTVLASVNALGSSDICRAIASCSAVPERLTFGVTARAINNAVCCTIKQLRLNKSFFVGSTPGLGSTPNRTSFRLLQRGIRPRVLDIRACELSTWPTEVLETFQDTLTVLNLPLNAISEVITDESRRLELGCKFNLMRLKLTEISLHTNCIGMRDGCRQSAVESPIDGLLNMTTLVTINLASNGLTCLPDGFRALVSLRNLDLRRNRFQCIPVVLGGMRLERLDLGANCDAKNVGSNTRFFLTTSFQHMHTLTELNLSDNEIRSLPAEIGALTRLKTLGLSYNRLSVLPDSISELINLERLTIGSNHLDALPNTIGCLKKLCFLGLRQNRLRALPPQLATGCLPPNGSLASIFLLENLFDNRGFHEFEDEEGLTSAPAQLVGTPTHDGIYLFHWIL